MNAAEIVFIALGFAVCFVVARKHYRIWRNARKLTNIVKFLHEGKQPVTVGDIAAQLEQQGIAFAASLTPLPVEYAVGDVVSARIVGENSNGQYEMVLPNGQSAYLSWYDVSDDQFQTLTLGDHVQSRIASLQGNVAILAASAVPVIPTD